MTRRVVFRLALIAIGVLNGAASARAQDRPFLFTVTTDGAAARRANVHYDVGVGQREFVFEGQRGVEQQVGLQLALGRGLTLLGSAGFVLDDSGRSAAGAQSAEALLDLVRGPGRATRVAIGGGVLHEREGTNVLRVRVAGGRRFSSSQVHANVLFERPLAGDRDALDLITTVGWMRPVTRAAMIGIEAIGQDLEGFWEADEAEGGARLLIGPSLHVGGDARRWRLTIGGGPVLHATRSARASDAARQLPSGGTGTGYIARMSLGYVF